MRVLLNGLTMLKPRTGVGQYTARLAAAMAESLHPDELTIYPSPRVARTVKQFLPRGSSGASSSRASVMKPLLKRLGRAALRLHFARHCRSVGATVYHEPNFLPLTDRLPTILTVHDLSAILHPEWHPADRARAHHRNLERAVQNAVHIITDTEQVKREIMRELRVPKEKITAIPLGVSHEFRPTPLGHWRDRLQLPQNYFLCVGTIEPRKNLLTVMKAFAALPEPLRREYALVMVGPWGWRSDDEQAYFDSTGRSAGIRHLGYVPDEALPALYSNATALLYPSHYEGFGLPPLEAAACGTISICNRSALAVREVMGNNVHYCNAFDIEEWCSVLRDATVREQKDRNLLIQHADRFTWQLTAMQTLQVYRGEHRALVRAA